MRLRGVARQFVLVAMAGVAASCASSATSGPATSSTKVPPASVRAHAPTSVTARPPAPVSSPVPASVPVPPSVSGTPGSALAAASRVAVKGRAPTTGYSRDQFGPAWADVDRNGCDTRNDVLNRDLTHKAWRDGTHGCVVISGVLAEPYTGRTVQFEKANAAAVQIDHVVALSDAWQTGAYAWDASRRERFANDPAELLAVDGPANEAKGDGDAATWLPPNKGYRCKYVARQVSVKLHWGLWATAAERDAFVRVLAACPTEPLPADTAPTAGALAGAAPPVTSGVYYANCAAARAAGVAPIHRGQPGYRSGLDRDNDGIACE
jgi:Protein of unknown function (DUF1524)/Excalibur calcium-binding domain